MDQSYGNGTDSFSIWRLTGRFPFLRLVLVPALIDSGLYIDQILHQILLKVDPILYTAAANVFAYSLNVLIVGSFPRAITSA